MFLQQVFGVLALLPLGLGGKLKRKVGNEEARVFIRQFHAMFGPYDGRSLPVKAMDQHLLDGTSHIIRLAGNLLLLVFNEFRDIRVLLEHVPHAVMVQVEAGVPERGEGSSGRDVVKIRAYNGSQELALGDARR